MKFPPDLSEAYCPACGIFVEILQSSPSESAPSRAVETDNRKRLAMARFYVVMEDVLEEDEEPSKRPQEAPIKESVHEAVHDTSLETETESVRESIEAPAEQPDETRRAELAPEAIASPQSEPVDSSPEGLRTPAVTSEPTEEEAPDEGSAEPTEAADEVEVRALEPADEPLSRPRRPAAAAESRSGATALVLERPVGAMSVPPAAQHVALEPEVWVESSEARHRTAPARPTRAETRPAKVRARLGHRVAFYVGAIQVGIGGAGLLLGSVLHDIFRVPLFGYAYGVFGPFNTFAAFVGGILTVVGLAAMALGSHAGKARKGRAAGG